MSVLSYDISISKHNRSLVQIENFRLEENHITFLFGESGIGKSLIAKAVYGLLPPEELQISLNGEPYVEYCERNHTQEIQRNSFFVFQEPSTHLDPLLTLGAQVEEGTLPQKLRASGILERLWNTSDQELLDKILGVYPKPYRPSGGEKQRFLLVMAFLKIDLLLEQMDDHARTMFVFDEPSGSLDNHFRDVFLSFLLEKFEKRKFTTLLITHDYSIISAVRKADPNILKDISYKELSLGRKGLTLTDFMPDNYLKWLHGQKPLRMFFEAPLSPQPLLRVASGMEVFGRRLVLTNMRAWNKQSALEIHPYSMVYLKAPSGVGKTTFAKAIMGLLPARNLRVALKNLTLTEQTPRNIWRTRVWGKRMTITFQHADEALNQQSTVRGTLSGLPRHTMTEQEILQLMAEVFDCEIDDRFLRTKVRYLSGGQKQKLNLIRSLVLDTNILILDEPFNGLDFRSIVQVLDILKERQKAGKGILLISHNEEIFDAVVNPEQVYYISAVPISQEKKTASV